MTIKEYFQQGVDLGTFSEKQLRLVPETACSFSTTNVVDGDAFKDAYYRNLKSCDCFKCTGENGLVFAEMKRLNQTITNILRGYHNQYSEEQLRNDPSALDELFHKSLGRIQQILRSHSLPFKYADSKLQIVTQMHKDNAPPDLIQGFTTRQFEETFVLLHDGGPQSTLSAYVSGLKSQLEKVFVSKYSPRKGIKTVIPVKLMSEAEFDAEYGACNGE